MPILINGGSGGAGGGGGEVFIVRINETYPYSADKTFSEIYEAYNTGRPIVALVNNEFFYLRAMYSTAAEFTDILTGSVAHKIYSVRSDGTVTQGWQSPLGRENYVNQSNTLYSTIMARGIYTGTASMTSGSSTLTSGAIYLQYE